MELISQVMNQFNLNETAAKGAVGTLFQNIGAAMPAADFDQVKARIPEVNEWMQKIAPPPAGATATTGAGILGAVGGLFGQKGAGIANLVPMFSQYGLNAESLPKFIPVVMDFVQTKLDPELIAKLSDAVPFLKPFIGGAAGPDAGKSKVSELFGKVLQRH